MYDHLSMNDLLAMRATVDAAIERKAQRWVASKQLVPVPDFLLLDNTSRERRVARVDRVNQQKTPDKLPTVTLVPGGQYNRAVVRIAEINWPHNPEV